MKIVVTGATGFIGRHVINSLLSDGYSVTVICRDRSKLNFFNWCNNVQVIEYDINTPLSNEIRDKIVDNDKLVHLAWSNLPNYNQSFHIENQFYNQFDFLNKLIKSGMKDITISGTCFEYGMLNGCLKESIVSDPQNFYSISKDTLRKSLFQLIPEYSCVIKWVRLFYLYGEGQASNSLIPQLKLAIESGENEFKMSKGDQIRDFLNVTEAASNIKKICINVNKSSIINCCSGKPISVRNFVENYIEENNLKIKLNLGYYEYSKNEPFAFWGDITLLKSIINIQ